jgi:FKBP-type peptidyl-prolyl cis-trans isomerase FkpA
MRFNIIILLLYSVLFSCKNEPEEITRNNYKETRKALVGVNRILVKKDSEKIAGYVKRRNWNMTETQTGLWYMIYKEGSGEKAEEDMFATINYDVSLLDGTGCYNSDSLGPKRFKIGQGGIETGLEEGILYLREGDKAKFILPPHLAHGLIGDENKIPARAIIVYDVELLNLDKH